MTAAGADRAIGLTERAAGELGITRAGSAEVLLEALVQ